MIQNTYPSLESSGKNAAYDLNYHFLLMYDNLIINDVTEKISKVVYFLPKLGNLNLNSFRRSAL